MNQIVTAKSTSIVNHRNGAKSVVFRGVEVLKFLPIDGELEIRIPGYVSNALLCRMQQGLKLFGLDLTIRSAVDHENGQDYLALYSKATGKVLKRLGWADPESHKAFVYQTGSAI